MNASLLIHLVVQQTTVLIAQLATSAGLRAPLARVANEVFLSLVRELESQGLRKKVIADMFGLALRGYQKKVRRLAESETDAHTSLWQAVLTYLQQQRFTRRAEVLRRFRNDDDAAVRGVLQDLVDSGLVFQTGADEAVTYGAATDEDLEALANVPESRAAVLWVLIYREGPLTRLELTERARLDDAELDESLERLMADGRVTLRDDPGGPLYVSQSYRLGFGEPDTWPAAVFDHYQAVITTVIQRLRRAAVGADPRDEAGGSTYTFDLWPGHPAEAEVRSLLARVRELASGARRATEAGTWGAPPPGTTPFRVTFYAGQNIVESSPPEVRTAETPNDHSVEEEDEA